MNKVKIIDLLNKIANGEEVPQEIRYNNIIRYFDKNDQDYKNDEKGTDLYLFFNVLTSGTGELLIKRLNEEVEIIGNTPKEKINHLKRTVFSFNGKDKNSIEEAFIKLSQLVFETREKTDEIVDTVNNLQDQINFIK